MEKTTTQSSVATIGIDLAKKVFQFHGIDSCGKVVIRRAVKRRSRFRVRVSFELR